MNPKEKGKTSELKIEKGFGDVTPRHQLSGGGGSIRMQRILRQLARREEEWR